MNRSAGQEVFPCPVNGENSKTWVFISTPGFVMWSFRRRPAPCFLLVFPPPESSCCADGLLCLGLPQNHRRYFWNGQRRFLGAPCVKAAEQTSSYSRAIEVSTLIIGKC